jgi:hypothetical protein
MIFWMIATLTTHHKMAKRKKPWLSYRTTLVPAPRTTACETLGAREDDEDRAWARALATSAFSSILLVSFSLRGRRSPSVLAVASWAWLGLARLGLAGGEKPKPRASSSSSSFRVIAGSFFLFILSQRSQLRSCSIGGNDWFPGSFSLPRRWGWPGIPHFSQPKKNHQQTHQLNRCR